MQCVTELSRLRVLLLFLGNTYNFGVFVSVWQTAVLVSVAKAKKEVKVRSRQKKSNFQHTDTVQMIRHTAVAS